MLTLEIDDFHVQLKEGTIHNVGGPTKVGTVKAFDITDAGAREFGDDRLKLEFSDADGNSITISVFPEQLNELLNELTATKHSERLDLPE